MNEKLNHLIRPADVLKPNDTFCLLQAYKLISGEKFPMPIWDDGDGVLWACWESVGNFANICGLVRATTWEKAWECAVDEVFEDPREEDIEEYASRPGNDLPEGWHYRGSGNPSNGNKFSFLKTIYACADTCALVRQQERDLREYNIHLVWETYALGGYNGPTYRNEKP